VLRHFVGLRLQVGHSECEEEQSRWNGIDGRQTGKDRWTESLEMIINSRKYDAFKDLRYEV